MTGNRVVRAAVWAGMLLLLAVTLFPFYWMVNTSLKPQAEVRG